MFPFDFEEYLWGLNESLIANEIKNGYLSNKQLIKVIHDKTLELYKEYIYIGGMPASIK